MIQIRYKYFDVARDGNGVVLRGATINVYLAGTTTAATIYTSVTSTTVVNSVTTSSTDGSFSFYVDAFDYGSYQKFKFIISIPSLTSDTFTADEVSVDEVVTGTYTISTAKTISYPVFIPYGVTFAKSGTGTISFNAATEIGNYQIFDSTFSTGITFASGTISDALPVWWGGTLSAAIASYPDVRIDGTVSTTGVTISTQYQKISGKGKIFLSNSSATGGHTNNVITVSANNVIIDGIEIDGNRTNNTASGEADGAAGYGNGIYVTNNITDLTIRGCYIHDTTLSGIADYGNHARMKYLGNTISTCGYMGIYTSFASNRPLDHSIIDSNTIYNVGQLPPVTGGGDGIGTVGVTNSVISNNTIKGIVFAGIVLEAESFNVTISGNVIEGNVTAVSTDGNGQITGTAETKGIQISNVWDITVTGNTVKACKYGISVAGAANSKNITISGNIIKNIVNRGIDLDSSETAGTKNYKVSVIGNDISNTQGVPIAVSKILGAVVEGNIIEGVNLFNASGRWAGYGILLTQKAKYISILNNVISKDSNGSASETKTGYMNVGIGEVYSGGTCAGNRIEGNQITGAVYYDTLTFGATITGGGLTAKVKSFVRYTGAPNAGHWKIADINERETVSTGQPYLDVCVTSGEFGAAIVGTATTTLSSTTVTFSDATGLFDAMVIKIAGAGAGGTDLTVTIYNVDPVLKTAGMTTAAGTAVNGAAVTVVNPTFKTVSLS